MIPKNGQSSGVTTKVAAGIAPVRYTAVNGAHQQVVDSMVVVETQICISINGQELATFMASPVYLEELALGFLANEGLIDGLQDVRQMHLSKQGSCVDIWLHDSGFKPPRKFIITAGCGGGVTFDDLSAQHPPLEADLTVSTAQLAKLMRSTHLGAELYQEARGIHTAVLATADEQILQVEDIGRHNCLDKIRGAALIAGIETAGRLLLTSGRISSEMINKARSLGTPIICSRTSPTSLSVALAESWNITMIAYLRQDRMRIYTHPERIVEG